MEYRNVEDWKIKKMAVSQRIWHFENSNASPKSMPTTIHILKLQKQTFGAEEGVISDINLSEHKGGHNDD
jgi:hypothetical protein